MNRFTGIRLRYYTIDHYFIRKSIFNAIKENIGLFNGRLLDVGCGRMPYKLFIQQNRAVEYIGLDIETARDYGGEQPDVFWDGYKIPLESNSFDTAMATEVLEHCPNPSQVLSEIARVLKPNAVFVFTVPYLWPLHEVPYDHYRYTPFSLKKLLEESGFTDINIRATGGWNATLAQMLGLWCRRGIKNEVLKTILSIMLFPVIALLFAIDKKPTDFVENTIYPSLYGTAKKKI